MQDYAKCEAHSSPPLLFPVLLQPLNCNYIFDPSVSILKEENGPPFSLFNQIIC